MVRTDGAAITEGARVILMLIFGRVTQRKV
jgi:hypothetical protein